MKEPDVTLVPSDQQNPLVAAQGSFQNYFKMMYQQVAVCHQDSK